MTQNKNESISNLLKKWELLWNHFKLQNESLEKRRNFLWLIQSALFYGWYHSFDNKIYIAFIIIFIGIFINISWIIILKRDVDSIFLTEESLRDVECQLKQVDDNFSIDRFILEKELMAFSGKHYYKYYKQEIDKKKIEDYWIIDSNGSLIAKYIQSILLIVKWVIDRFNTTSIRKWITLIIPSFFFLIWIILVIISLVTLVCK